MKSSSLLAPLVCAATVSACTSGPFLAPPGSTISAASTITLAPSYAYLQRDAIGALFKESAMVMDVSSIPLPNVKVEVMSGSSGVYLIPETAVELADYPAPPEGLVIEDMDDVAAYCDSDENNAIDDTAGDWCSWWWLEDGSRYYELSGSFVATGDFQPNYMTGSTDSRGLFTFYVFIDQMPAFDENDAPTGDISSVVSWAEVNLYVSIEVYVSNILISVGAAT